MINIVKNKHEIFVKRVANVNPNIEIIGEFEKNCVKVLCRCVIHDVTWEAFPQSLLRGRGCKQCGIEKRVKKQRYTKEQFVSIIKEKVPNVDIIGDYLGKKTKIKVRCKKDGYEWNANPDNLMAGEGCPVCSNNVVVAGINDIATTHPQIVKYFKDQTETNKYSYGSKHRTAFVCPICQNEKVDYINNVSRNGFICRYCDGSISLPTKMLKGLMSQLPVENVIYEYSPDWARKYRYDAYFEYNGLSYVVEMDGGFHYRTGIGGYYSQEELEATQNRDNIKDDLTKEHGIIMIRIDCNRSKADYVTKHIKNSVIADLFDLSNINWDKIVYDKSSIDAVLSDDSINPVQNKVVTKALNDKISQVKIMPTPSENELGKIVQYVGRTTGGYIKGFFYRCAEVPDTDPTEYEWVNQEVQESTDGEAKVNATAVTSLSGLADGFYLLIDSTATPIYQLKEIASGVATDSDKEVDTCLIDYVLYNDNKVTLDTLDIVWVVTGTPDISDYKTEFETAKSGVRSNADYTFEWDSDVLSVGDFADFKSQWNDFAVFMHNNKGRLAMITIDQYNFGFSDDDTGGSSPTLICIIPELASISEDYSIRIPYGAATSTHCDGYGFGFIDINWRLNISLGKCDFAGINTILFKGTDSMSTGYSYHGSNATSVYINETEYSMNDATERATAYNLYHQGVTITIKLL